MGTTFPRWENDTEATFVKDLSYELSKYFNVNVLVPHYKGLKLYDSKEKLKYAITELNKKPVFEIN